jgi:hypothetical protein
MTEIFNNLTGFWSALPGIAQAIIILFSGLFVAKLTGVCFRGILRLIRFDKFCSRVGFTEFLRKGGTHYTPVGLVSTLVFWVIALLVFMNVSRLLDLYVITEVYESFSRIIPGLIAAVLVLITGWALFEFSANFAVTVARNAGFLHAEIIGQIIRYLGLILVIIIAVGQVEIGTGVLGTMLLVLFSAVCFGAALAFGLGCKDIAHDIALNLLENLRERSRQGKSGDLEG